MASTSTANRAAVIESKGARIKITDRPIPTPGEDEILVRNYAIACNPVDWKTQEDGMVVASYPVILGSDVCGEVISIGSGIQHFSVGDRVLGCAGGPFSRDNNQGAWQTYTIVKEVAACKIPSSWRYEEGAVLPMGMSTAGVAFFQALSFPREILPADSKDAIIIWGAASSVGVSAVQIARVQGWRVLATASPHHHEWLRKLGATVVFDYQDPEVVAKIGQAAKDRGLNVRKAYDAVSEGSTFDLVPEALQAASGEGGNIATVLWWPESKAKPAGIEVEMVASFFFFTKYKEMGRWFFNEWLEKHLADGSVVPAPPIEMVEGGIAASQRAFDRLKAGVSGKKVVVKVD
jgi:NADPH:quinone reductase-like Zn-dependent oxidoreductase